MILFDEKRDRWYSDQDPGINKESPLVVWETFEDAEQWEDDYCIPVNLGLLEKMYGEEHYRFVGKHSQRFEDSLPKKGWDWKGLSIFLGVGTMILIWMISTVFGLFVWAGSTLPDEPKRYPQGGSGWSMQQLKDLNENRIQ